jgi:hypothetical protein
MEHNTIYFSFGHFAYYGIRIPNFLKLLSLEFFNQTFKSDSYLMSCVFIHIKLKIFSYRVPREIITELFTHAQLSATICQTDTQKFSHQTCNST